MLQAYFEEGMGEVAVFSLFVRRLPERRNYLLACGLDDVLAFLETLRFDEAALAYLDSLGRFSRSFLRHLEQLRQRRPSTMRHGEAVAQWSFRPARVRGIPVSTLAYILLGFPVPVGSAPMVPGGPHNSAESFSRIAARSAFQGRAIGVRQGMKSEAARCGSSC